MMGCEIVDLEKVFVLTKNSGKKITSIKTSPLTAPGENYGSKMLAVHVKMDDNTEIDLVAKMPPPNEWIKKMFQVPITFKKEVAMYETIFPLLRQFQEDHGVEEVIDFYPRFYGARISLDPNENEVTDDALLLLENLKYSGFEVVDRMIGFDLPTAQFILRKLAVFHAVPIAFEKQHPYLFDTKIKPYCSKLPTFEAISEETEKGMLTPIIDALEENEKCTPFIESVRETFEQCRLGYKKQHEIRPLYATINHCDYWVNNMMVKFTDGKPTDLKMVDFQIIEYGSAARDLVFFLFTSIQNEVLEKHYDDLVELYYESFVNTLEELQCDISEYSLSSLIKEMEIEMKSTQFLHIMVMMKPIFSVKGKVKELSEMTEADMLTNDMLSDTYKRKVCDTVLELAKKGWI